MDTTAFKKPTGVYLIAILFILAPFGNILISFAGSGVSQWYNPSVFLPFLHTIPALDWLWLGLLFVTGILLLQPHKTTWSLAIAMLVVVLAINAYRVFNVDQNSIDPTFLKVFAVLAIVCTLSVLVVSAYFRFPYLDRRAKWISKESNEDRRDRDRADQDRRDRT